MKTTMEFIDNRKKDLVIMKRKVEQRLKSAPTGTLRISKSYGRIQFYHRECVSDRRGKYLSASNDRLIRGLAQKRYDEQVLAAVNKEIEVLTAFAKLLPKAAPEEIYDKLSQERRVLVEPVVETDESFISRWKSVPYKGKDFSPDAPVLLTDLGERVRSKSELIIAQILNMEGVPYRYEYPVVLDNGLVYPDFTVLNIRHRREIYWEHLGMLDDPEYTEKALRKISGYMQRGIFLGHNLILSAETKAVPISTERIRSIINYYCK